MVNQSSAVFSCAWLARSFSLMVAKAAHLERQEQGALFLCGMGVCTEEGAARGRHSLPHGQPTRSNQIHEGGTLWFHQHNSVR